MKKIALIAIALFVVAAVALPPVIGMVTEKTMRAELEASLTDNPYVEAELVEYQRGYRTSTGRANFVLAKAYRESMAANAESPEERQRFMDATAEGIPLHIQIEHGPVVFENGIGIALSDQVTTLGDSEALEEIRRQLGVDELVRITSRTSLTSKTRFDLSVTPFDITEDGQTLRFSGLESQGSYSAARRRLTMDGGAESLSLDDDEGNVKLNGMTFDVDITLLEGSSLGIGTTALQIDSLAFSGFDGDAAAMAMTGFGLVSEVARGTDDRYLTVGGEYSIDSVSVPGYEVTNVSIPLLVSQMDVAAMGRYQRVMTGMSPDTDPEEVLGQMRETLHAVFAGGPTLKLGPTVFELNGDRFEFDLDVVTKDGALPDMTTFDVANTAMWLGLFRADARLNIDEKLLNLIADSLLAGQIQASLPPDAGYPPDQIDEIVAQQKEMMIGQFVDQGFVTFKDDRYTTTFNYDGGELLINGTPFPLEALMGP